jgi:hypothetical protein
MNEHALAATNNWWNENKGRDPHHFIVRLLPFMFDTLDALHFVTRSLPLHTGGDLPKIEIETPYTIILRIYLDRKDHVTLRSALSLTGDIYNIAHTLIRKKGLLELENPVKEIFDAANRFRHARDFFTHLEQMMTGMEANGVSGPAKSPSGIRYSESAKFCVHLIWHDNVIYYTKANKDLQTTIEREAFDPIFDKAEDIYRVITNHVHSDLVGYAPIESLYPR